VSAVSLVLSGLLALLGHRAPPGLVAVVLKGPPGLLERLALPVLLGLLVPLAWLVLSALRDR
jgi:hypothetical protein